MKLALLIWLAVLVPLCAFDLDSVVNPVVRDLPEPALRADISGPALAISSKSEKAAAHVKSGIAMLNSAWDFEAYRHFSAAAKEDPDCLMAYWGIVMSLAGSGNEFKTEMPAALDRMLDLVEAGQGSELERGFAYAAAKLNTEGGRAASLIFKGLAEDYPGGHLAEMWAAFFQRDGFDELGKPRLAQEKAVSELRELVVRYPGDDSLVAFWLVARAEMPDVKGQLGREALPMARKLARQHPDFPPYQHLLGHYEYRNGNAELAAKAFRQAVAAYEKYMTPNKLNYYDCPGLLKSQMYLAAALADKGDLTAARPIFSELASREVDEKRLYSAGATLLMWEGRSLGARYLGGQDDKKSLQAGLDLLGKLPAPQWHAEHSTAALYKDCLAIYLGTRKAIIDGNLPAAKGLFEEFGKRGQHLNNLVKQERHAPSRSHWIRAIDTLAVLNSEIEGLIALASDGSEQKTALNWFRSAAERQTRPSLLMPPPLPNPMENRLGQYFILIGESEKAADAYRAALQRRPNHLDSLKGYQLTLEKTGKKKIAAKVAERISLIEK